MLTYLGASPLARINPVVKLLAFCALTFAPIFFLDPFTPLAFLLLAWVGAWPLAHIAPWRLAWRLRPYLLLAGGLALFNAIFYGGEAQGVLWVFGPLQFSPAGVAFGAAVALRLLCMISYTLLYFATTEPTELVNSLIVQARLPYKLAFTILATYRFLPILQQEMAQIGAAQRIRAVDRRVRRFSPDAVRRVTIPLLAGGIRRAERLALAMDGRGFGAGPTRTFYVQPRVGVGDLVFLMAAFVVTGALLWMLARVGWLSGWLVGVAEQFAGVGG